ncbi:hypothetical protein ABIC78_003640 [Novosphingobium sp. 1529]|uniref:hypothetical protein n=1 Tax=Novosphingobium sp. 1529 TaxID=3156424 RepID=UPI003399C975
MPEALPLENKSGLNGKQRLACGYFPSTARYFSRFSLSLMLFWACSVSSHAQDYSLPKGFDPPAIAPDRNGVDLMSGRMVFQSPVLAVEADPRLKFQNINDFNIFMRISKSMPQDGPITAVINYNKGDGESETFDCSTDYGSADSSAMPCISHAPLPSYAKGPAGLNFYEARTGRTITFGALYDTIPTGAQCYPSSGQCSYTALHQSSSSIYYANSITYADGEILTISYDTQSLTTTAPTTGPNGGTPTGSVIASLPRPSRISSNRGFELRIAYQTDTLDPNSSSSALDWLTPKSASMYAIGSYNAPLASISFSKPDSNLNQTVTDANGNNWYGTFNQIWGQTVPTYAGTLLAPSASTNQINASSNACSNSIVGTGVGAYIAANQILTSLSKGGDSWTYNYSNGVPISQCGQSNTALGNSTRSVSIVGPNGYSRTISIDQPTKDVNAVISKDTDSLGRSVSYVYTTLTDSTGMTYGRVMSEADYPEGNKELFTYDNMGNVTQVQRIPKPGSSLATAVVQIGFPQDSACFPWKFTTTNGAKPPPITCTRPLWIKDANGKQTDYTWQVDTGLMLTQTDPADMNGVRPQVRYSYAQRYAWWSDGSGGYVKAASPIWVKVSESRCRNSAATGNPASPCQGNDEILTTFDYGPDSGPNFLLVRGMAVTADGNTIRTCFSYDARGRKISQTQPNGTGGTCS